MKVYFLKKVKNIVAKEEIAYYDVFKIRLLQKRQKASVFGKGLI